MPNSLFNPESIGNGGFYWWTGIIVSDESWKEGQVAEKWSDVDTLPGWGARYKVRIVGKNPKFKNRLEDKNLELCDVIYPVTAGSGHAASYQTSNLRQGSVVLGFYKDGIDGNEPIILGCIGNNEQTFLNRTQKNGFDPLSAFNPFNLDAPYFSVATSPTGGQGGQASTWESNTLSSPTSHNIQDENEVDENSQSVSVSSQCDKAQLGAIQLKIKNLIRDIEKVRNQANDWRQVVTNGIQDVEQFIKNAVDDAAKFIAGGIKWVITEIQKFVTQKVNNAAKDFYYFLFPNQRPGLKRAIETANDLIACLFRKIISNLLKMVADFLLQAVNRFINVPLCAVENMVGGLLGKITGLINSALNSILAPIKAILGAFDLVGDVVNFLVDILTFLSCDEEPDCPEVREWNIWDGPGNVAKFDLNSLVNNAKSFASNVTEAVDPNNFNFDLDFSDIFDSPCNVGPVLCGPPTVEFFGGGGFGASGNVIIGSAGDILGVDIVTPGSGYTSPPFVRFVDACGSGTGAVGRAVIGPVGTNGTALTPGGTALTPGGTALTLDGTALTPGGTALTPGGTALTPGGTALTPGGTALTPGGTALTPDETLLIPDGTPLNLGGTGGIPLTVGGINGTPLTANGTPLNLGGTGGIPLTVGGINGTPLTANGTPLNLGGTGGIPLTVGETSGISGETPGVVGTTGGLGVIGIVIEDPGTGYRSSPNGDRGGDGRVWAPADNTTVQRSNGTYDTPYVPGDSIELFPGDIVRLPNNTSTELGDENIGGGVEYTVNTSGTITAPVQDASALVRGDYPVFNDGKYPVILYLSELEIQDSGFNYQDSDEIIIEPNNGAAAVAKFGEFGAIESIKVTSPGEGFKEVPSIYIQSETGYNAKLLPIFVIDRVSKDEIKNPEVQDKIISVIDCVGKVPDVNVFRVPQ